MSSLHIEDKHHSHEALIEATVLMRLNQCKLCAVVLRQASTLVTLWLPHWMSGNGIAFIPVAESCICLQSKFNINYYIPQTNRLIAVTLLNLVVLTIIHFDCTL